MNIAHIEKQSFIYGPGCRFVIWTQGCSIRCKGCWNDSMWEFTPKINIAVSKLFAQIMDVKEKIEGVTLLGGEPLDQYGDTAELLRLCKKADLTTMLFTGYEMCEIIQKNMIEATNYLDIIITGRYEWKKRTLAHQWIGSKNQKIHFLSDKYKNYKIENAQYTEISITADDGLTILGFPDDNIWDLLKTIGSAPKTLRQYYDI